MTNLRELQETMQDYVLRNDLTVSREIIKPENMKVDDRLHVYRNAYYLRLVEILEDDYSVLREILGKKIFDSMARDYLDAFPSHHFSVRSVGKYLPKFLKSVTACDKCYSELAELEWALNEALYASNYDLLMMEDLSKIPPEQWALMRLTLQPSVRMVNCCYNTIARWQSVNEGKGNIDSEELSEPQSVLVWRYDNEPYYCALTKEQAYLIHGIAKGDSFGMLCENMLNHFNEDEVVSWVAETLQTWVIEGIFSGNIDLV